jgi:hypothetical protein
VYYLRSNGPSGEVGPNSLNNSSLFIYNSLQYSQIFNDIRPQGINLINFNRASQITFTNTTPSSKFSYQEDVKSIKENAKNTYKTQYRLINSLDFENFIKKNFSNLIQDVKVVNNNSYVSEHLNYFKELGLSKPNLDSRILFNQISFGDACNFNNIYIYCAPKIPNNESKKFSKFLNIGLKEKIKNALEPLKVITSEIIFQDPVYVSVGLGVSTTEEINNKNLYPEIINETKLIIKKTNQSFISDSLIKENIVRLIFNYFDGLKIGEKIDIEYLNSNILKINGVESFYTERTINNTKIQINGFSFLVYNPVYSGFGEDIRIITQSLILPYFKVAYYDDFDVLMKNIVIE